MAPLYLSKRKQFVGFFIVRLRASSAQAFGEVAYVEHLAFRHHAGTAEDALQLPDVALPRITSEDDLRARRNAADGLAVLLCELLNEEALQQREILPAIR